MRPRERAASAAGVDTARQMAHTAVTIEVRDNAHGFRQQAAAAAIQVLAVGSKVAFLDS